MKCMLRTAVSALLVFGIANPVLLAESVNLYTWRQQEVPLWEAINKAELIDGVNVDMSLLDPDNYESKLRIAMQTNRPDLFQFYAGAARLGRWIDAGVIKPLVGVNLDGLSPASLNSARGPEGKIYGVPFAVQMQSIIYNKKVFADNGVEVPTDLAGLDAAFAKLKEAGVTPMHVGGRSGWWLNQVVSEVLLAGLASDEFSKGLTDGSHCFTEKPFVAAIDTFKSWMDKGYFNDSPLADDYAAMRTGVALGDAATMIDGVWSTGPTSPMFEVNPDLQVGFMPIPGEGNHVYAFGDGSYLLNAHSENLGAAAKVQAFTATKEFAELFAKHVGELPAYGGDYTVEDERLQHVAGLITEHGQQATPYFSYRLNMGEPGYGQLLVDGLQSVLAGKASGAEVAKMIQDELNAWGYVGKRNCS